jgi:Spy/CpxP family protein refolding chaperone
MNRVNALLAAALLLAMASAPVFAAFNPAAFPSSIKQGDMGTCWHDIQILK